MLQLTSALFATILLSTLAQTFSFWFLHWTQDPNVTDIACMALNGMKMGDKTLTVRRATASGQAKPDQVSVLAQAQQQIAMQRMALTGSNMTPLGTPAPAPGLGLPPPPPLPATGENPTKVLCLSQVLRLPLAPMPWLQAPWQVHCFLFGSRALETRLEALCSERLLNVLHLIARAPLGMRDMPCQRGTAPH